MSSETILALLTGSSLGALIAAGVTLWTTNQQISSSDQHKKIDVLQSQIAQLRDALQKMSAYRIDLSDPTLTRDQIHSRVVDAFSKRAQIFATCSYMFSESFERKIGGLSRKVDQLIYDANIGKPIDETIARNTFERISKLGNEMPTRIRGRLRTLQLELDEVTISSPETDIAVPR